MITPRAYSSRSGSLKFGSFFFLSLLLLLPSLLLFLLFFSWCRKSATLKDAEWFARYLPITC